jgi:hypothetical protein
VRRPLVLHPFLVAAYPVLFLLAHNLEEHVSIDAVYGPLLVSLAGAAVVLGCAWIFLRDWLRAGLVTSVLLFLFFSYGQFSNALSSWGMAVGDPFLLGIWGVVALAGVALSVRSGRAAAGITRVLNLVTGVLVVINVLPIVSYELRGPGSPSSVARGRLPEWIENSSVAKRDIYYLIFDRYARADTLRELYDYDNSATLDWLERRGFYVASESLANYPKTAHSLASSLNMTGLRNLSTTTGDTPGDYGPLFALLSDFRVARYLKALGYRYVHMGSWWHATDDDPAADIELSYDALSEFSSVLLETTIWGPLGVWADPEATPDPRRTQYRRIFYQFEKLGEIPNLNGPTFTFAHFLLPHPPYVVDPRGGYVSEAEELSNSNHYNYVRQLEYTNTRLKGVVENLLNVPDAEKPIVIIQSDEGPHPSELGSNPHTFKWTEASDAELEEKLGILNAYYLPGKGTDALYPSITPINTFRLLFNLYFDAGIKLVPDRVWVYEGVRKLYEFTEVTHRLRDSNHAGPEGPSG